MKNKHHGFTLLEAMITLALAAIIASMAIPNLKSFLDRNQLVAQMNQIISVLAYARSEAAKRGFDVTLCIRDEYGRACGNSSRGYAAGFLIFTDYRNVGDNGSRSNGTYDRSTEYNLGMRDSSGNPVTKREQILMVTDPMPDNITVEVTNENRFGSYLTYTPNGNLSTALGFSITLKQDGKNKGKITFDLVGRPRSCVLRDDGEKCKSN